MVLHKLASETPLEAFAHTSGMGIVLLHDAVFACLAWLLSSSDRPNLVFVLDARIFQFAHRVRIILKANCKMGIGPLL